MTRHKASMIYSMAENSSFRNETSKCERASLPSQQKADIFQELRLALNDASQLALEKAISQCNITPKVFRRQGGTILLGLCANTTQAQILKTHFAITEKEVILWRVVDIYIQNGSMALVQWLLKNFAMTDRNLVEAIRTAIRAGRLKIAQWLGGQLGFPKPRLDDCGWLLLACAQKDSRFLRWLADLFPQSLANLRSKCLKVACKEGNLEHVCFLDERLHLNKGDILDGDETNEPFRLACRSGNIPLAAWMFDRFALTKAEIMNLDGWTFALCAREARLFRVGQWLAEKLALTLAEITSHDHFVLRTWLEHHELNSIQWFISHFAVPKELLQANNNFILRWCREMARTDVLEWLTARYNFSAQDFQ